MSTSKRNSVIFNEYQSGITLNRLAIKYRTSRQRIYQILKNFSYNTKIPLRKRKFNHKKKFLISKKLAKDYSNGLLTQRTLALKLKCSICTISKRLHEMSIDTSRRYSKHYNRALLYQRYVGGETAKEISAELGITIGNFKTMMFNFRQKHSLPPKDKARSELIQKALNARRTL